MSMQQHSSTNVFLLLFLSRYREWDRQCSTDSVVNLIVKWCCFGFISVKFPSEISQLIDNASKSQSQFFSERFVCLHIVYKILYRSVDCLIGAKMSHSSLVDFLVLICVCVICVCVCVCHKRLVQVHIMEYFTISCSLNNLISIHFTLGQSLKQVKHTRILLTAGVFCWSLPFFACIWNFRWI